MDPSVGSKQRKGDVDVDVAGREWKQNTGAASRQWKRNGADFALVSTCRTNESSGSGVQHSCRSRLEHSTLLPFVCSLPVDHTINQHHDVQPAEVSISEQE